MVGWDYVTRVNVAKAIAESQWIKTRIEALNAESVVVKFSTGTAKPTQEMWDEVYNNLVSNWGGLMV